MQTELFVLTFYGLTGAETMLKRLEGLKSNGFIELSDIIVVTKGLSNKIHIHQPLDVSRGKGAAFGALTGAIIGMLGGPGGAVVGMVSGAVTGAVTAAVEEALPQADIKSLTVDVLERGESALIVYVDEVWIDQIERTARDLSTKTIRHTADEQHNNAAEKTATVSEDKIETAYKSWQAHINKLSLLVTKLRQQAVDGLQTDRDSILKQLDTANQKLAATYTNVLQTLRAWGSQIDAHICHLEVEAQQTNVTTKANIERRLAEARHTQQILRLKVKDTLSSQLSNLQSDLDNLRKQASTAEGVAQEKLNQRIITLDTEWKTAQKRLDKWDDAREAAWYQVSESMDSAFHTFDAAVRESEAEYEKLV